jgi:hypothetical protein
LRYREAMLAEWERLNWRSKLDLWRRSLGAFQDALALQPRRLHLQDTHLETAAFYRIAISRLTIFDK